MIKRVDIRRLTTKSCAFWQNFGSGLSGLGYMANPRHKNHFIDIVGEEFVNVYVDKSTPEVIEWYL